MATNYVSKGDTVTVPAPTGGVQSGVPVLIGVLFGVPLATAAEGVPVAIRTCGIFTMSKASQAFTVGQQLYWNNTNAQLTSTASGNTAVGPALAAAASGDATGRVLLK